MLDETYDLVVVGGGISGLAAAYYYRKLHRPGSRILILDNHDDFGGHAKRNEFHQGGPMRLAWGGTVNMEYPKYSEVANGPDPRARHRHPAPAQGLRVQLAGHAGRPEVRAPLQPGALRPRRAAARRDARRPRASRARARTSTISAAGGRAREAQGFLLATATCSRASRSRSARPGCTVRVTRTSCASNSACRTRRSRSSATRRRASGACRPRTSRSPNASGPACRARTWSGAPTNRARKRTTGIRRCSRTATARSRACSCAR